MKTDLEILFEETKGKRPVRILLVAGEASGDEHGALLVRNLRKLSPEIDVYGMGGSALRTAGMDSIVDSESSASVMGLTELFGSIGKLLKARKRLLLECERRKPDAAVLIDFPDFNLRLAKSLAKRGIKVLYFISPQLWAWRSWRVRSMRKYVDKVAAIFPFEETFYRQRGVDAEYVGHPFLDREPLRFERDQLLRSLDLDPAAPMLALLPGSRRSEIERLLEPMLGALRILRQSIPNLQAVIPVAPTIDRQEIRNMLGENKTAVVLISGFAREVLATADAAIVASGTITVEAALAEVPFAVVYKLSPFTYKIAKLLVRGIKHFAMPNLIAGEKIVEEYLQDEVTAERIAAEALKLLTDESYRAAMKADLRTIREKLRREGEESSGERTAKLVLEAVS